MNGNGIGDASRDRQIVHFIGTDWRHHSSRSGTGRLVEYVSEVAPTDVIDGSGVPVPSRLAAWVARRASQDWYSTRSVRMEAEAFVRLASSRRSVWHILRGEDDLHYLGRWGSLRRLGRNRLLATFHQPPDVVDRVMDRRRNIKDLDAVIVMGSNQVAYFGSLVGKDRVFRIPHGVDTGSFTPGKNARKTGGVCLFVGDWLRDFDMLRGVVDRVGSEDPNITFRIVAPERRTHGLEGKRNVRLRHSISDDDLLREYRAADVLLLPYLGVVASNSLLEGLACGLPVVSTRVGAITDYVSSDCACLVEPGDVVGMSEALRSIIGDERRRRTMRLHARRRALDFDWVTVARMHVDLYRRMAA